MVMPPIKQLKSLECEGNYRHRENRDLPVPGIQDKTIGRAAK